MKAGDLSLPEADLIQFLYGVFDYEGNSYKVKSEYIAQARDYMMQDDVTLTSEDKKEAISLFYENFKKGIDEGYVEVISDTSQNNQDEIGKEQGRMDSTVEAGSNENTTSKDNEVVNEEIHQENVDNSKYDNSEDFLSNTLGMNVGKNKDFDDKKENSNQTEGKDLSGDNNEKIDANEESERENADTSQEELQEPPVVVKDQDMIKETGFHTTPLHVFGVVGLICFFIVVGITVQTKLAAKKNVTR